MTAIADRGYAHPDALVSTDWVAAHANDPDIRVVESNEDPLLIRPATFRARSRWIGRATSTIPFGATTWAARVSSA